MPSRKVLADAVRCLSMDAVQKANSGHPGAPMGMADMAEVLWNDFMTHNPANPQWMNRDRFVLSNGHASMLIYSMLHLTGYDLTIDDIKNFRQLHSKTAGHPEYMECPGVETTTGPLGQGIANGVGMALAEKMLAEQFNRDEFKVIDHFTYVFLGDGCMMEGISHEACSYAGALELGKLIALYDDNGISIDGEVEGWFVDDTAKRFEAYNWHVIDNVDGHDPEAVKAAIEAARAETSKPSLICCKTHIAYGSPNKQDSSKSHGAPLGDEEIALVREKLGWEHPPFEIPTEVYEGFDARQKGSAAETAWNDMFTAYGAKYPELAADLTRRMNRDLPEDFEATCEALFADLNDKKQDLATRKANVAVLEGLAPGLPELLGGSADLTGSNGCWWSGSKSYDRDNTDGNYLHYGVREFGMSAFMNGMVLHGGLLPYSGTFLVFSDYLRNAFRMAALMQLRAIWILTHDSIGVGEDGPTHQPVEHATAMRCIPNAYFFRPCDVVETAASWKIALEAKSTPSAMSLTRQGLPFFERDAAAMADVAKGGYILRDCEGEPEVIIIGTGSETKLAVAAAEELAAKGTKARVVSMYCCEVFDEQDQAYKDKVLPPQVTARVAVESGTPDFWYKYVGLGGRIVGMTTFGASAPGGQLFEHFGFTTEAVVAAAQEAMA